MQQRIRICFPAIQTAWRNEDGSALVEASVLTPLLVSLYFGVFDFSWYFYNQQLVEAGVRDAARYMARIELTNRNTNPCVQTDPTGTLYTINAANIAVAAQTASGGTARHRTSSSTVSQARRSAMAFTLTTRQA
jgi:Flp pilus assembly protein TadG